MVRSMTGFGRCEYQQGERKFTVEMKAVNHRYFDVNVKIPKKLGRFETNVRSLLKKYIQRGKVELYISYEDFLQEKASLKYNSALGAEYVKYYEEISKAFGLENDAKTSTIARSPEVLTMEEQDVDEDEIWSVLEKTLKGACERFVQSRVAEGENLKSDMIEKLEGMTLWVEEIEKRYPRLLEEYRSKLMQKVRELTMDTQIDENRLATEVVIYSDKICTDEETVRLKSHIEAMMAELEKGGAVGRKLDFIAQEMNREANTILSKANDLETSNIAIDLKTEIEKVREQIQNLE